MNKLLLYLKQILLLAVGSKLRFVLTLLGLLVGLYVFSTGNMFIKGYYNSLMYEISQMPDNSIYVYTDEYGAEGKAASVLMNTSDTVPIAEHISMNAHTIYERSLPDNQRLLCNARMHGMTAMGENALIYDGQYQLNMIRTELTDGRFPTNKEIADNEKVCVIDESTAKLLFGGGKAVGSFVVFNYYDGGQSAENAEPESVVAYEVVGVIKDSYYNGKAEERLEKLKKDGTYLLIYDANIFCPYNYTDYLAETGFYSAYLWTEHGNSNIKKITNDVKIGRSRLLGDCMISEITSQATEYADAEAELKPIETGLNFVVFALIVITGIFNMSILFFAMKERIQEIGIKKAFGATPADIVFQFILENIVVSLVSIVISLLLSIITIMLLTPYLQRMLLSDYHYFVTWREIAYPVAIGILESMLFTLIPGIRYSCMSSVEALRVD